MSRAEDSRTGGKAPGLVKGVSFMRTVELVHGLVQRGVVVADGLEVRLSRDALAILDDKIEPSLWYSVTAVDELSRMVVEFLGDGRPAYMRSLGRKALEPLLERSTFRNFIEGSMRKKGAEGQNLVGLASLIYNFGRWTFEGQDLRRFVVTLDDAAILPELARESIAGFMEALVQHCIGEEVEIETVRPAPERIVFYAHASEGEAPAA